MVKVSPWCSSRFSWAGSLLPDRSLPGSVFPQPVLPCSLWHLEHTWSNWQRGTSHRPSSHAKHAPLQLLPAGHLPGLPHRVSRTTRRFGSPQVQGALLLVCVPGACNWHNCTLSPYARNVVAYTAWFSFPNSASSREVNCCLKATSYSSQPCPPHLLESLARHLSSPALCSGFPMDRFLANRGFGLKRREVQLPHSL